MFRIYYMYKSFSCIKFCYFVCDMDIFYYQISVTISNPRPIICCKRMFIWKQAQTINFFI